MTTYAGGRPHPDASLSLGPMSWHRSDLDAHIEQFHGLHRVLGRPSRDELWHMHYSLHHGPDANPPGDVGRFANKPNHVHDWTSWQTAAGVS